jgi:hypothetical protein
MRTGTGERRSMSLSDSLRRSDTTRPRSPQKTSLSRDKTTADDARVDETYLLRGSIAVREPFTTNASPEGSWEVYWPAIWGPSYYSRNTTRSTAPNDGKYGSLVIGGWT